MSYIITYYLPSGLFVVVSWISFLIPPDIVPGQLCHLQYHHHLHHHHPDTNVSHHHQHQNNICPNDCRPDVPAHNSLPRSCQYLQQCHHQLAKGRKVTKVTKGGKITNSPKIEKLPTRQTYEKNHQRLKTH